MNDSERIARLEVLAEVHTDKLDSIGADIKSLLESRAYGRGAARATAKLAAAISTAISVAIAGAVAYFK